MTFQKPGASFNDVPPPFIPQQQLDVTVGPSESRQSGCLGLYPQYFPAPEQRPRPSFPPKSGDLAGGRRPGEPSPFIPPGIVGGLPLCQLSDESDGPTGHPFIRPDVGGASGLVVQPLYPVFDGRSPPTPVVPPFPGGGGASETTIPYGSTGLETTSEVFCGQPTGPVSYHLLAPTGIQPGESLGLVPAQQAPLFPAQTGGSEQCPFTQPSSQPICFSRRRFRSRASDPVEQLHTGIPEGPSAYREAEVSWPRHPTWGLDDCVYILVSQFLNTFVNVRISLLTPLPLRCMTFRSKATYTASRGGC